MFDSTHRRGAWHPCQLSIRQANERRVTVSRCPLTSEAVTGGQGFEQERRVAFPFTRLSEYRARVPDPALHRLRLMREPSERDRLGAPGISQQKLGLE